MKVAIPIWHKHVSSVLDFARRILVVESVKGREIVKTEHDLPDESTPRKVVRLCEMDIDVLVCGAVSRQMARMLTTAGIRVVPNVSGRVDDVIAAYLTDSLDQHQFTMPGCRRRTADFRGGRRCRKRRGKSDKFGPL